MKIPKPDYKKEKRLKKKLEKEKDIQWHKDVLKKWGNICFFHNSEKRAKQHQKYCKFAHHIKPKGLYPEHRYNISNGLNICWPCHYKLEKSDKSMILDVVLHRGKKWWEKLNRKAKKLL